LVKKIRFGTMSLPNSLALLENPKFLR
jgi:hypothetical protein